MEKLLQFYKKYTGIIYPALFIVGVILIIFQVILPAFSTVSDLNGQIASQEKVLSDYKNSASFLKDFNDTRLSTQAETVTSALPPSKDIQALYMVITSSAFESRVSLRGFSLSVGDVFQKNEQKTQEVGVSPYVVVNVKLSGVNLETMGNFITALSKKQPLNKVSKVNVVQGEGDMDINFYYKPYDLSAINKGVVKPLTSAEEKIIGQLSTP